MKPEVPNCYYRISVKALILDGTRTKFLVVQEDNGKWEFPGGGLDWGESPESCLRREIKEEMGLEVTSFRPQPSYFITQQKYEDDIWIGNVFYELTLRDFNFTPSEECVAFQFVTREEALQLDAFPNVPALAEKFDPANHRLS